MLPICNFSQTMCHGSDISPSGDSSSSQSSLLFKLPAMECFTHKLHKDCVYITSIAPFPNSSFYYVPLRPKLMMFSYYCYLYIYLYVNVYTHIHMYI